MPRPIQFLCVVIAAALATAAPASARVLAPEAPPFAPIPEPVDAAPQTVAPPFNTPTETPPTGPPPTSELSDLPRGEQPPRGMRGPIEPPPDQAPRMGLGLLISGVGALAGGVTFIVAAAGELAPGPSDGEGVVSEASDTAGLAGIGLGVGVAGMIAGLVMLPFGAVRLHRWRDWKRARPTVNRSAPGTWIAGVTLRF